ncbi:hypothetical protein FRB94_004846 [Tulasnella sp. JGI-2019a]|nr:hypothetical protein FRB93_005827 [Tulasnella sp. JGI-2019a]KAG9001298.1 hypothetical protein FRB94_004846 [Tulasnella sp. JGI-2019a]
MPDFFGFEHTENVTFPIFTETPIRKLQYNFPCPELQAPEEYESTNYPTIIDWKPQPTPTTILAAPSTDVLYIKTMLRPAAELNLSALATDGLVPKTFKHSHPDVNPYTGFVTTTTLEVDSVSKIHNAIRDNILPNLHYGHRVRTLAHEFWILQGRPDGMIRAANDQRTRDLVAQEDAKAYQRKWHRTPIFVDEKQGGKLGMKSWLWGNVGMIKSINTGQRFETNESLLFTYVPRWITPKSELDRLSKADAPSRPKWFAGIHQFCQESGTRHVVIYTGDYVVVAVFEDNFDTVKFFEPLHIDTDLESDVSIFQVIIEVMVAAECDGIIPIQAATDVPAPAAISQATQTPAVQPPSPSSSSGSLKRRREDEPTLPTPPRTGGLLTPPVRRRPAHSLWSVRTHNAVAGPSNATTAVAETPRDEEQSPPAKRARIIAPPAAPAATAPSPTITPADDTPAAPSPTAAPIDDAPPSNATPPPTARRSPRTTSGITYAERQTKLAKAHDSKKRADLKKGAKALKATRRSKMAVAETVEVDGDEPVYEPVNGGDAMEEDVPEPVVAPPRKAKKVSATTTTRAKKVSKVKTSVKKAVVQAKTKTPKPKATKTAALDPTNVVHNLRSRKVLAEDIGESTGGATRRRSHK